MLAAVTRNQDRFERLKAGHRPGGKHGYNHAGIPPKITLVVRSGSKESDVRRAISMLIMAAAIVPVSAQEALPRVSLPRTESRDFISKINNREYSVLVSLPPGYTQDATTRFPVIYLTDANWVFATTAQTHFLLSFGNMVPAALIVGIVRAGVEEDRRPGNTVGAERFLDLTPTRVAEEERSRSKEYQREVGTGGAAAFLRVVREELIPDVERRYRTNGDRTFIGYSLGGLFGIYTLFHQPEIFQRMILVSPSVFWDGNVVYKYEEAYASAHQSLPVRLFMSMGEGENDTMIGPMRRLENAMRSRRYEGLQISTRIFTGERHLSTFPVAVTRGLRTVFADPTLQ